MNQEDPHSRASDQIKLMFGIQISEFDLHLAMDAAGVAIVGKAAKSRPPPPPLNFTLGGTCQTGEFRLGIGWFGVVIIEEKIAYHDGSFAWRKRSNWDPPVYFQGSIIQETVK